MKQGFAIIRVDRDEDDQSTQSPGPSFIKVKAVLTCSVKAQDEVDRLNRLNSGKGCIYYWQPTKVE